MVGKVEPAGDPVVVYNMSIAGAHTFFVGKERWGFTVWVHNSAGGLPCEGVAAISRQRAIEIRDRLRAINQLLRAKNVKHYGNDVAALNAERERLLNELPGNIREMIVQKEIAQKLLGDATRDGDRSSQQAIGRFIQDLERQIDEAINNL